MENNELEQWYDEQKEGHTDGYMKYRGDEIVHQFDAEEEDRKQLAKQKRKVPNPEKKFLEAMRDLHKTYEDRYYALKQHEEKKKERKSLILKLISPALFIWKYTILFLKFVWHILKDYVFFGFRKGKEGTVESIKDVKYQTKEYYTFHWKHTFDKILVPLHFAKKHAIRPFKKKWEAFKVWRKEATKQTIKKSLAIWAFVFGKAKDYWGAFMKRWQAFMKVVQAIKAVTDAFKEKYITPIMEKFKKKEDDKEEE